MLPNSSSVSEIKQCKVSKYLCSYRLLHMICYPDSASHTHPDIDQKTMITRLLEVKYFYYV